MRGYGEIHLYLVNKDVFRKENRMSNNGYTIESDNTLKDHQRGNELDTAYTGTGGERKGHQ